MERPHVNDLELPCTGCELQTLSDAELASLIIEFVGGNEVALALGEETYRPLRALRALRAKVAPRPIRLGTAVMANSSGSRFASRPVAPQRGSFSRARFCVGTADTILPSKIDPLPKVAGRHVASTAGCL
jgi:hypothetical protein